MRPEAYIAALVLAVLSGVVWLWVDARESYFTDVAELRRLGARRVEEFWEEESRRAVRAGRRRQEGGAEPRATRPRVDRG